MLFDRLLLRTFFPVFLLAILFFVLIIQLMDLFSNLVRFLNLEVPLSEILNVQLLFVPRAVTFSLPVALLFAAAYTLGTLYGNNELIAVFDSGVSIRRFTTPFLVIGMLFSIGVFFFQEYVVIDTYRRKNEETRRLLNISRSLSNSNITVRSPGGEIIYSAEYYNDAVQELSRVMILRRRNGRFAGRIDAERALWSEQENVWILENGTRYELQEEESSPADGDSAPPDIEATSFRRLSEPAYSLPPERFRRSGENVDELRFDEARRWVFGLRDSGQPYRQELTDYYSRFSFSLTPFIVLLLSCGLGGRFRKNILLMSLLLSLVAAVVYYVTGMVMELLAGNGTIPPLVGAWAGVVLFTVIGIILIRTART